MARAGLSQDRVVEIALELVDESGTDSLTLAAIAARAGVATPSLYAHVSSLAALRGLLAAAGMRAVTDRLQRAIMGRSGDAAVRALMHEIRAVAVENPRRYGLVPVHPGADPEVVSEAESLLEVFWSALRGYELSREEQVHAVRRIRAATDGFVRLEVGGGFGMAEDVNESYRLLVDAIIASLHSSIPPVGASSDGRETPAQ